MKCVYTRLLRDEELRPHLERGDAVVFKEAAKAWHDLAKKFGSKEAAVAAWKAEHERIAAMNENVD